MYVVIPILFLILTYVLGFCEALFVFGILGLIIKYYDTQDTRKHRKEMKEWTDKLSRRTPTDTDYQSNTSELSPDEGSFIGIIK